MQTTNADEGSESNKDDEEEWLEIFRIHPEKLGLKRAKFFPESHFCEKTHNEVAGDGPKTCT